MEIKDLTGLGKAVEKLIDVVSSGVGKATKSYFIRKEADAEAYRIKRLTDAANYANENSVQFELRGNEITLLPASGTEIQEQKSLLERLNDRKDYKEAIEQINTEQVTSYAFEELKQTVTSEDDISNEQVDSDWISRFFDTVEQISTDDMQKLWGKVLAGEIKQPGSFSLRTMDKLKNISRDEAELFINVAQFAIKHNNNSFIMSKTEFDHITYGQIMKLDEIGLISIQVAKFNTSILSEVRTLFIYGNQLVIVEYQNDKSHKQNSLQVYPLTNAGHELLSLVNITPNEEYLENFARIIAKVGDVVVKRATITEILDDRITHDEVEIIDLNSSD